jgi:hypothetical protein
MFGLRGWRVQLPLLAAGGRKVGDGGGGGATAAAAATARACADVAPAGAARESCGGAEVVSEAGRWCSRRGRWCSRRGDGVRGGEMVFEAVEAVEMMIEAVKVAE